MSEAPLPDTKTHLRNLINALRMSAFPRVVYQFADAFAPTFVPTKSGARAVALKVAQIKNDAAFRHWICENAELSDVSYCRMALHVIGDMMEQSNEEQLRWVTARLAAAPLLCKFVLFGLESLERSLRVE